jgi:hypothetical protein
MVKQVNFISHLSQPPKGATHDFSMAPFDYRSYPDSVQPFGGRGPGQGHQPGPGHSFPGEFTALKGGIPS